MPNEKQMFIDGSSVLAQSLITQVRAITLSVHHNWFFDCTSWLFFFDLYVMLSAEILRGSPWAGASNKGGVGKISHFLALNVNISKTVGDMSKVTIGD